WRTTSSRDLGASYCELRTSSGANPACEDVTAAIGSNNRYRRLYGATAYGRQALYVPPLHSKRATKRITACAPGGTARVTDARLRRYALMSSSRTSGHPVTALPRPCVAKFGDL